MYHKSINDDHGCSTCQPGQENWTTYTYRKKTFYQYDFRTSDGRLFSCCAPSLEDCRERRDKWINELKD